MIDNNKNLLELTNDYSKFKGDMINTQKSIVFLYAHNEQLEFAIF